MRKFAAVLLALIFAGSVGGVGCFAAANAIAAAASAMACCTPDCPAPNAPNQAQPNPAQSCATQTCAPSVEVAPSSYHALHPRAALAWAVALTAPPALRAILTVAAARRFASPPSFDSSLAFDRLCSRQI